MQGQAGLKDRYLDREFSWLSFNQRVLDEAFNSTTPLLERIKYLAIVANNLDEFFEVRVAGLLQKIESGILTDGIAEINAEEKLEALLRQCQKLVRQQYKCWNEYLLPALQQNNIHIKSFAELNEEDARYLKRYFQKEVYHLLTPIKLDPTHPFPWVLNKSLCLLVILKEDKKNDALGVITIPRSLPRLLSLPSKDKDHSFIFIYDVIQHYIQELFRGYVIKNCSAFRATRNSNLYVEEEEGASLIDVVEAVVHNRRKGNVVRLEIDKNAPKKSVDELIKYFDIEPNLVFRVPNPVNLNRVVSLYNLLPHHLLKYSPLIANHSIKFSDWDAFFKSIQTQDIFLHHPYDSFDPVVQFIQSAARDPKVLAIKQTLYRTNQESQIMYALLEAAELGKEVVVVVELQARFDEKSNIGWARELEEYGGTVVYGLVGLKTHSKLALVVRKEEEGFSQYAHIGTGNYNPDTAKNYTDLSLLTANSEITNGVSEVFNFLTSQSKSPDFNSLLVGPVNLLSETLSFIRREKEHAQNGRPALIVAKMNALFDAEIIEALYSASQAGVQIKLIVRGICALRPGIKGLSENIQVKSLIGRFLEHSRIFFFANNNNPVVYMGSADWMDRNMRKRVEVLVSLKNPIILSQIQNILSIYWADNKQNRLMRSDGNYTHCDKATDEEFFSAQDFFSKKNDGSLPPIGIDFSTG